MKKFTLILTAVFTLHFLAFSQEKQVIRYSGLALGTYFTNTYPVGNYSNYFKTGLGGGLTAQYAIPLEQTTFETGISLRSKFESFTPVDDIKISNAFDITVLPGLFARIPFNLGNLTAAVVPELSYGFVIHKVDGEDDSDISGFYTDGQLCAALGLRLAFPKVEKLEIELTPVFHAALEKSDVLLHTGFRSGILWHFTRK